MNRRGILGEGILMMYRLTVIAFVAFIILGTSSVFYAHYIDVRDAEAIIMTRSVMDCIAPEGVVNLSVFGDEDRLAVLSYCGFDKDEVDRFYVSVNVNDSKGKIVKLSQGDSGALWVKEIFKRGQAAVGIKSYEPGYSKRIYDAIIVDKEGASGYGKIEVEVLVSDE